MAIEFKLPDLGENIEEADVLSILVKPGDTVAEEQGLIEVETDKATMEVPSPSAGNIVAVHVSEGDIITPGQLIVTLEAAEAAAAPASTSEKPATAPEAEPPGEPDAEPAAAETDPEPAVAEAEPAPPTVAVESEPAPTPAPSPPTPSGGPSANSHGLPVSAAPSVRKLAREIGVDIATVPGSGPGGRISSDDVKAYARSTEAPARSSAPAAAAPQPLPDFSSYGEVHREPMTRVRRSTAENLANSWSTIPHVTIFERVDVTALEEFRQRYKANVQAAGGKLTMTAILMKIVASALKSHPRLNASIDMLNREVVYKDYVHLGVAADTDRGLLVPVVRDVDKKSITEISTEVAELANKARAGKLTPDDMSGATFTVSNLGGMRTGFFTPIINPPEVAILGVGHMNAEPVVMEDGSIEARRMLHLGLSFDHRLVDGAHGARFMAWLVDALHEPLLISLAD